MTKSVQLALVLVTAVVSVIGGFYLNQSISNASETKTKAVSSAERRPDFTLPDLEDKQHTASEWDGKVLMINFWATWCPPCRREIPAFIKLQDAYRDKGLVVIGIAIDNKQSVIDFADPMGINYPILLGERDGVTLAEEYGNHLAVLPYTAIVDRQGHIIHTRRSELTYKQAEALIKPLL